MKFRNLAIILLSVFVVLALVACKEEVKTEVNNDPEQVIEDLSVLELYPWSVYEPTESVVYEITVTEDDISNQKNNKDKLKLEFAEEINAGDVITLKYRSERTVYQWDIRDASNVKWVYENDKNGFVDPVVGEGGWCTLTYTFGNNINGESVEYPYPQFSVYLRGNFIEGDTIEIMDITLTRKAEEGPDTVTELEIDEDSILSTNYELTDTITDHVWEKPRTYAVLVATGEPGDVDKNPIVMKVAPGEKVDFSLLKQHGVTKVYFDEEKKNPYYKSWKVVEDGLVLYYNE